MNRQLSLFLAISLMVTAASAANKTTKKKVSKKAAVASTTTIPAASSSSASMSDLKKPDEKKTDIDDEITDARLRAQLGSKSVWSFKSSLAYSGGSIQDPLNSVRPNYRASATIESMTSLSGDVGVNYRAGERDNFSFGTGITIVDPLHGDITKPAEDVRTGRSGVLPRYEVSTPYLGWSRGYKAMGTQMVSSVTYAHATDSDSINLSKSLGSLTLSQTILANFGNSNWNGGASISLSKAFYTGDITDTTVLARMAAGTFKRLDLSGGVFPFLQYSFNDTYSFRTVFGYFQFARYDGFDENIQLEPYQSVGTGISITRDIYIYPNIQFTPKDVRAERTNVAISANINLF